MNGKYYINESDITDASKGTDKMSLNKAIEVKAGEKMTMRVEMMVYDTLSNAQCNCNFSIDIVNEKYASGK